MKKRTRISLALLCLALALTSLCIGWWTRAQQTARGHAQLHAETEADRTSAAVEEAVDPRKKYAWPSKPVEYPRTARRSSDSTARPTSSRKPPQEESSQIPQGAEERLEAIFVGDSKDEAADGGSVPAEKEIPETAEDSQEDALPREVLLGGFTPDSIFGPRDGDVPQAPSPGGVPGTGVDGNGAQVTLNFHRLAFGPLFHNVGVPLGDAVDITAQGSVVFPLELQLDYDPREPLFKGITTAGLDVYYFDEANGVWSQEGLTLVSHDPQSGTVKFRTTHLTIFRLGIERDAPPVITSVIPNTPAVNAPIEVLGSGFNSITARNMLTLGGAYVMIAVDGNGTPLSRELPASGARVEAVNGLGQLVDAADLPAAPSDFSSWTRSADGNAASGFIAHSQVGALFSPGTGSNGSLFDPERGGQGRMPLAGDLVINEVLLAVPQSFLGDANGDGETSRIGDQFIEVVNAASTALNLSGVRLLVDGQLQHVFPEGMILPAGQAAVVFGVDDISSPPRPSGPFGGAWFLPLNANEQRVEALIPGLARYGAQWLTLTTARQTSNPFPISILTPIDPDSLGFTLHLDRFDVVSAEGYRFLRMADLNRNLNTDALAVRNGQELVVFWNDGTGRFESDALAAPLPEDTNIIFAVEVVDLTANGAFDILVADTDPAGTYIRLTVMENAGGGSFVPASRYGVQTGLFSFGPRAMAVGDIDGDGDPDVVFAQVGEAPIIFRNTNGQFTHNPATDVIPQTQIVAATDIALADLNRNGKLDLVLSASTAGLGGFSALQVFLNTGSGQFVEATEALMPHQSIGISRIRVADINGDHAPDIIAGSDETDLRFFMNNGLGVFSVATPLPFTREPNDFALRDIDADGDLDLLFAGASRRNAAYLNDGQGNFELFEDGFSPEAVREFETGDIDNDGDIDGIALTSIFVVVENTAAQQNRRPVLDPIPPQSVVEQELLQFAVRATDADGDVIVLQAFLETGEPVGTIGAAFEDLGGGQGLFRWTPEVGQGNAAGALYVIRIQASDGQGADEVLAVIRVYSENRPPELQPIADQAVNERATVTIDLAALASDPDGDALEFSFSVTPPAVGATLTEGIFHWVPNDIAGDGPQGYVDYPFTFIVTDPHGASAQQTATIRVYDVFAGGNHPPVFENLALQTAVAGEPWTFTVIVSDADGDAVTVQTVGALPQGMLFDAASNTFNWTPDETQIGEYELNLQATDGTDTTQGAFTLQVLAPGENLPPQIIVETEFSILEGHLLQIPIEAVDPEGEAVVLTVEPLPSGAVLLAPAQTGIANTWRIEWTPDVGQSGFYVLEVEASDGVMHSTETVVVTVIKNNGFQPLVADNAYIANDSNPLSTPFAHFDSILTRSFGPGDSLGMDLGRHTVARVLRLKLYADTLLESDPQNLKFYYSHDNGSYTEITDEVSYTVVDNTLIVDGLDVAARYLKVHRPLGEAAPVYRNTVPDLLEAIGTVRGDVGAHLLLEELAHDTFRYFEENVSPSGLIPDRVRLDASGNPEPAGVYSSGATGFWLAVLPMAVEHGWITRDQGAEYARTTLKKYLGIGTAPVAGHLGFYYHFINEDGSRYMEFTGDGVSVLDSAILFSGALACSEYFDADITDLANQLIAQADWDAFYDHNVNMLRMWWNSEGGFHRHLDYVSEGTIAYILAAGAEAHPIQPNGYVDTPADAFYAFSHGKFGRVLGKYGQEGRPLLQSFFGSLFTYLYPGMFYDVDNRRDDFNTNWSENTREAILANYRFAQDHPNRRYSPVNWGLSASDGPHGYQGRYGAKPLDVGAGEPIHDGTITPYALAGSLPYAADIAMPALLHLAGLEVGGKAVRTRYGLRGAVNSAVEFVADDYIGIDQGAFLLGVDAYLSGTVRNLIAGSDLFQRALTGLDLRQKTVHRIELEGPRSQKAYLRLDSKGSFKQTLQIDAAQLSGSGGYLLELHPHGMDTLKALRFVDVEVRANGQLVRIVRFTDRRGTGVVDIGAQYVPLSAAILNEAENTIELRWVAGERWLQLERVTMTPSSGTTQDTWQLGAYDESHAEFVLEREVDDSCFVYLGPSNCKRALNVVDVPRMDILFERSGPEDRILYVTAAQTHDGKPVTVEVMLNNASVGFMELLPGEERAVTLLRVMMETGWNKVTLRHAGHAGDGEYVLWDAMRMEVAANADYFQVIARNVADHRIAESLHFGPASAGGGVLPATQYLEIYFSLDGTFDNITISTDNRNASVYRFTGPPEASASGLVGVSDSTISAPVLWQVYDSALDAAPPFTDLVEWAFVPDASESNFWEEGAVNYRTLIHLNGQLAERPAPGRFGTSPIVVYLVADLQGKKPQNYATSTLQVTRVQQ